jgi:excisionase family DNA binding protein
VTSSGSELLTAADVQALLRVSRGEAYRLLAGPIPTVRLGRAIRVRPSTLEAWLRDQERSTNESADPGWTPASAQEGGQVRGRLSSRL